MLLTKKGIKSISFAVDGVEAVKAITESRSASSGSIDLSSFDLIFMDNTMPNMVRFICHELFMYYMLLFFYVNYYT